MKLILASLFAVYAASGLLAQTTTNMIQSDTLNWNASHSGQLNYLYYLPQDYEAGDTKHWPLMLFLHGAGERGNDIQRVTIHGPLKLVKQGRKFPFIIVAPQCAAGEIWKNDELLQLLKQVKQSFRVDETRVYLVGLSMGGYGTWKLATCYPEKFAAIVPISGGADLIDILLVNPEKADALKSLPVWAFHGAQDPVVPVTESESSVAMLKKIGATEVKLTIYPDATHDAWTRTFENPELYDWLLRHHRTNAAPAKP